MNLPADGAEPVGEATKRHSGLVSRGEHEVLHVAEAGRVLELLVARFDPVVGDAAVPLAQRDPELSTGEVRTEAAVHTAAERDVGVDLAIEAHLERIAERAGRRWPRRS